MKILIDGDGSPVKDETIALAEKYHLPVIIVTSIAHYTTHIYPDYVDMLYVERGADRADYKIIGLIEKGDVVITQDYGLASLVLTKAHVMHHTGMLYTPNNIDQLLTQRYLGQQNRKAGKRTKGLHPFSAENRQQFIKQLGQLLATLKTS